MKSLRRAVAILAPIAFAAACGADPAVRAASHGDVAALGRELDERAAQGKLDEGAMRKVARALLAHDLERVAGDDGAAKVASLAMCARSIEDSLRDLSASSDAAGAAAAELLVDVDLAAVDAFTPAHVDDPVARWKAVATRGMLGAANADKRAARSKSDDRYVRLAAVEAAGDSGCVTDFSLLLDSARRDPDVMIRVSAVRALARVADRLEGDVVRAELVDRLVELAKGHDDALRGAVARALAAPALYPNGGERALLALVGNETGHVSVEAAGALMMAGSPEGALRLAQLAAASDELVRAHALRLLDPQRPEHLDVLASVLSSTGAETSSLRYVAASSLAHLPAGTAAALPKPNNVDLVAKANAVLAQLALDKDRVGTDAAITLAELGHEEVRPRLVEELKIASPMRPRVVAALARLGHVADAHALFAAADVDLRDAVACAVLAAGR